MPNPRLTSEQIETSFDRSSQSPFNDSMNCLKATPICCSHFVESWLKISGTKSAAGQTNAES